MFDHKCVLMLDSAGYTQTEQVNLVFIWEVWTSGDSTLPVAFKWGSFQPVTGTGKANGVSWKEDYLFKHWVTNGQWVLCHDRAYML